MTSMSPSTFACVRLSCVLTPLACGTRHRRAASGGHTEFSRGLDVDGALLSCRRCDIGARHAALLPADALTRRQGPKGFRRPGKYVQ